MKSAIQRLIGGGLADKSSILGCSEEDLRKLEANCGFSLPRVYRDFLRAMGRSAGDFLVGTDWQYPGVFDLRETAEWLLKENKCAIDLPKSAFVFAAHQGYQFLYFDCAEGDDPPIYFYLEGKPEMQRVFDRFSFWLKQCIEDEIAALHRLKELQLRRMKRDQVNSKVKGEPKDNHRAS